MSNIRLHHRLLVAGFLVVLVSGFSIYAISRTWIEADGASEQIHDTGPLLADFSPRIEHTFRVANNGRTAIKIIEKVCTCICTTTEMTESTIAPSCAVDLKLSVATPKTYSGKTSVRCELHLDDGSRRMFTLAYEVFPKVRLEDDYLSFGDLAENREGMKAAKIITHVVTLGSPASPPPVLRSVQCPRELTAVVGPGFETSKFGNIRGLRYQVDLKFAHNVTFDPTEVSSAKHIDFHFSNGTSTFATVSWRRRPPYLITPNLVFFGQVSGGEPSRIFKVIIKANDRVLKIRKVFSDTSFLRAEPAAEPIGLANRDVIFLNLSLTAPLESNHAALSGTVKIEMDDKDATVLDIPWSAFVRRPAAASAVHD